MKGPLIWSQINPFIYIWTKSMLRICLPTLLSLSPFSPLTVPTAATASYKSPSACPRSRRQTSMVSSHLNRFRLLHTSSQKGTSEISIGPHCPSWTMRFAHSFGMTKRNVCASCWAIMLRPNPSYTLAHRQRLLLIAHQISHQSVHLLPISLTHWTSFSLFPIHLATLLHANGNLCELLLPTAGRCHHHACRMVIFLWSSTLCITPMSGIMQQISGIGYNTTHLAISQP